MKNKQSLQFNDPAYYGGYTIIANIFLEDPKISSNAFRIYILLRKFAWQSGTSFPSHQTLADLTGLSTSTVARALNKLKSHKLISWKQRGMNKSNLYKLNLLIKAYPEMDLSPVTNPESPHVTSQDIAPMTNKEYSVNNTHIKNTQLTLTKDKYSSFNLEARELAKEFNDFESIKYYQKLVYQEKRGELESEDINSARTFVIDLINTRQKDNLSLISNPAGLFVNKLNELRLERKLIKQREEISNNLSKLTNKMKI